MRRYLDGPTVRPEGVPDAPYCVVCGARLAMGSALPAGFLPAPALSLQPIPPEPMVMA